MTGYLIDAIKKIVPLPVKEALLNIVNVFRNRRYKKKLGKTPFNLPSGGVALNYGGVIPREPDAIIHGGKVKLIALDDLFPENSGSFNVLYLVSSALPPFAEEYVRWAKGKGVKLVWNQNGVAYPAWAGAKYEKMNRPMKSIINMADFIFYQSRFCRESADRYLGETSSPWGIAYNYVDTDVFTPSAAAKPMDTWNILSAGSHLKRHRAIAVLETAANLIKRGRKIELTMAGPMAWEGAATDMEKEIERLSIGRYVKLVNSFTRDEAPGIYQNAHVLLHTKYFDPCPTVPLESMACGVPVVGVNNGGMPELVSDKAGILVETKKSWEKIEDPDTDHLAEAVERVMENYDEFCKHARLHAVENFGKDKWLDDHKQVFTKLVNDKN
ncbi:hypothetical protein MNBD_NITROSPINAE02-1781 [hydrothermal vent metagenome]|uniref:Glycosyl transferase family 1 domain-containing protein n=1 Tax=hydrothermal vent metagenome TaxID=652676 RepID=A0A3B1CIE4_9ZZZZ